MAISDFLRERAENISGLPRLLRLLAITRGKAFVVGFNEQPFTVLGIGATRAE